MAGVIGHIANPTLAASTELAVESERAGASWIGLADAFWWRDVWMALTRVADATDSIEIGPAMTNAYLRHPFHTASALATLAEIAPGRTFVGVTAGGSEVTAAAGIARSDAPERVRSLVELLRATAFGAPLDAESGRTLDVPAAGVPVLIAGRGERMLRTAGAIADRVLLWAIPDSDLERSIDVIRSAAIDRERPPQLIWSPLVEHDSSQHGQIMHVAVYASLNTRRAIRETWGLDDELVGRIRSRLVAGATAEAAALVPGAALEDLLSPTDPEAVAGRAAALGISALAVPGYSVETVGAHVTWARSIEAMV